MRTESADNRRPAGMTPVPVVVMNRPSAAPLGTTLVSPVTICTPALAAAAAISATISFNSAIGKPSSSTNAAEIQDGTAPAIARSLQVPCTASSPMEPPGKRLGCTTNESVDMAIRSPLGRVSTAPSPSDSSSRVAERLHEHRVDQCRRGLSARPVRQGHVVVEQPRTAPAERLDALDDLAFGEAWPRRKVFTG